MKTLVFIETDNGAAVASSWEALGNALELGGNVAALVIGAGVADVAAEAGGRGAGKVYVIDDASRAMFDLDLYRRRCQAVLGRAAPTSFWPRTPAMAVIWPGPWALTWDPGVIADCLELKADGGKLIGVRRIYAGNILVDVSVRWPASDRHLRPRAASPAPSHRRQRRGGGGGPGGGCQQGAGKRSNGQKSARCS